MNNHEKIAVDPQIKKEINEEGFEYGGRDNEEVAVLIGKKEDMPQMLERLEKEGMAENVGTYIKMHKEIILPNTEMVEGIRNSVLEKKGLIWKEHPVDYNNTLYKFIDKDGNIASVLFDGDKISDYKKKGGVLTSYVAKEFVKLGFSLSDHDDRELLEVIGKAADSYRNKIKDDLKNKKKEEFNF